MISYETIGARFSEKDGQTGEKVQLARTVLESFR